MKSFLWGCVVALGVSGIADAKEPLLSLSDLPVVQSSEKIYQKVYPGAEEFSQQPTRSLSDFEYKIQRLKTTVEPSPPLDTQKIIAGALNDPQRLTNISQTVYRLTSYAPLAYAAKPLSDSDVTNIARNFFNALDPYHVFFTEDALKMWTTGENHKKLLQAIKGEDLSWVYAVFNDYTQIQSRMLTEAVQRVNNLPALENSAPRSWVPNPNRWPQNSQEQKIRWSASIQDDVINSQLVSKNNQTEPSKIQENYERLKKDMLQLSDLDKVEIFLKAYTEYVDPHSLYLAPRNKNAFSMQITNVLQGVGIVWGQDKSSSAITVQEIIPNGPAFKSNEIKVGDQLIKIGQSPTEMQDVKNMRLEDVVDHTRGAPNTSVYFVLQNEGGTPRIVAIKRETIQLEANHAKGEVINSGKTRVLLINIPGFYRDEKNPQRLGGSVSYDVQQILEKNTGTFDVVVLDLRNNGGGVMSEAVNLVSLFLDKGIGVQVKTAVGAVSALPLSSGQKKWNGPLTVVVNRRSASASEIAAAALQDYGRALVIGETTYGKGTAQTLFDFDEWAKMPTSVYGQINLTTMMFFRPRGASTQRNGVRPDVWIGDLRTPQDGVESSFTRALAAEDVGSKNFVQPTLSTQDAAWQSNRVKLQDASVQRWGAQNWFVPWRTLEDYSKKTLKDERSLVFDQRREEYQQINSAQTQLKKSWDEEGKTLNDGLGSDVFMREALLITQDAFFPTNK